MPRVYRVENSVTVETRRASLCASPALLCCRHMEINHSWVSRCLRLGRVLLTLIACGLLAACRGQSTVLTDKTCQAPCWKGINPGRSTVPQVVSILKQLPEVKATSILVNKVDADRSNVFAQFSQSSAELDIRVYTWDQVAVAIYFDVRGALTFAEVFSLTGDPESVYAESGCADSRWLSIGLLNKTRGIYMTYFDSSFHDGQKAKLSADSPVSDLVYFDPANYDKVLQSAAIREAGQLSTFSSNLKPWTGFGEVSYVDVCH
jgi:hypothetical protein